mmetsp:Transcript_39603/g.84606  ORF Transcript_39603/g.84606 Transcript_39603/m.84606 type:complete len:324 (-) Transcript_39603:88-1059(-)|eukprot:CAMPEP_0206424240 /NCGR_PEP_ID=MMETSP0324_2-20121206/3121_1 /ASSEMBLY_ACC=CAM_ASM_000836 /TAXON_ID=2866 /ORGANISM="Crypthecodinium cohnii, Strain Seligo" /LENGTH=323 /DNA_ID=CAMNT_0053888879 /DNA_START=136 /DNA_END=1107 /DNA_ORIENTATION=+
MAAAAKYAQEAVADESDRPLKVCAEAGRKCVRQIQHHPILSDEWMQLVDSLKQLTRLVQLEGRMPTNAKVSEIHGRNSDNPGTLWDQEAHENAIRILVEEAKVNLSLRMMNDFKQWQYTPDAVREGVAACMQTYDLSQVHVEQKMRQFEESMGQLLCRAFAHVETLQLMDIPLLIEHCGLVLNHVENCRQAGLNCATKSEQEVLVLYYVSYLFRYAEALNNSELLAKSKEQRLLPLLVAHATRHAAAEYPEKIAWEVALGLSALADNEDFQTEWKSFFETPADMGAFMGLQPLLVAPIIEANPEKKREIRPLLDLFNKIQRNL